ncbi:beta-porphyranase A-like isoform X2 [Haliotis rubra]|uniref:beta-porphyranase A-like isoform X2 n=1 Tax=Haliotis rubra TaxID=36100 RepID=UPI001EE5D323|nr:beta-porphyranase A-like isoform X2 [Haliotis rubra]
MERFHAISSGHYIMVSTMLMGLGLLLMVGTAGSAIPVTIYPQFYSQAGRVKFETGRWSGHNGVDIDKYLQPNVDIGTHSGRWISADRGQEIFQKCTEDPKRPGYPDPTYFWDRRDAISQKYIHNINKYGRSPYRVISFNGLYWPDWMPKTTYGGKFPQNMDAASEFMLLFMEAVNGSAGGFPPLLEVYNEPGADYKYLHWDTVIAYHQAVAKKLKTKFPALKVGGPTNTGTSSHSDKNDFKIWKRLADFMNLTLTDLDFFSLHDYSHLKVAGGRYNFYGSNPARLGAFMDLVENYAHVKTGKDVPLVISEYGLTLIIGINDQKPSTFADWAYVYQHNAHMFTYLGYRDVIYSAIVFLISYTDLKGQASINHSLFERNGTERTVSDAFKFWKSFHDNQKFLRVDNAHDGSEKTIASHAVANVATREVTVLLHNYDKTQATVNLIFPNNWLKPASATSTCFYRKLPNNVAVFQPNKTVHISHNQILLEPESSCFYSFKSGYNFGNAQTINEVKYYGAAVVVPIQNNTVNTQVGIPYLGNIKMARLRVAVSVKDRSSSTKPRTVSINGHVLTSFLFLSDAASQGFETTLWEVYEYNVPVAALKELHNTVVFTFGHVSGYVSSVAIIVGR